MTRRVSLSAITTRATLPAFMSRATSFIVSDSCEPDSRWIAITTMATAAMINNKVTTNDWFLGFTVPPKIIPERLYQYEHSRNSPSENLIYFSNISSLQVWMRDPAPLLPEKQLHRTVIRAQHL